MMIHGWDNVGGGTNFVMSRAVNGNGTWYGPMMIIVTPTLATQRYAPLHYISYIPVVSFERTCLYAYLRLIDKMERCRMLTISTCSLPYTFRM